MLNTTHSWCAALTLGITEGDKSDPKDIDGWARIQKSMKISYSDGSVSV